MQRFEMVDEDDGFIPIEPDVMDSNDQRCNDNNSKDREILAELKKLNHLTERCLDRLMALSNSVVFPMEKIASVKTMPTEESVPQSSNNNRTYSNNNYYDNDVYKHWEWHYHKSRQETVRETTMKDLKNLTLVTPNHTREKHAAQPIMPYDSCIDMKKWLKSNQ